VTLSTGWPLLVAAGDAPSSHVQLRVLLGYVQTGFGSFALDAVLVATAVGYVMLVVRGVRAGRPWPPLRTASFLAGLLALFVALGSGLAAYDDLNASLHVIQHALLMMVAPPLLVLGRPISALSQLPSRRLRVALARLVRSRPLSVATGPAAWLLYYGTMAVYFLSPLYALSIRNQTFHEATHGWFFLVGYLFWSGLIGVDGPVGRHSRAWRIASVIVGMPVEAATGFGLIVWSGPLAVGENAAQAHAAGQVLWMVTMFVNGLALAVLIFQWVLADERAGRALGPLQPIGPALGLRPSVADVVAGAQVLEAHPDGGGEGGTRQVPEP
jgi:cytochrome c oxidase assembly factor CtaG